MSSQKMVFIVRHGQGSDIVHPSFRRPCLSTLDPSLTDLGTVQSERTEKLINCLKSSSSVRVISSPFLECIETALRISRNIEVDWRFADFLHILNYPMNICEDITCLTSWFRERFFEVSVRGSPPGYPEEYEEMKRRVLEGFNEYLEKTEGDLVVVTHLMPLEIISSVIKGEEVRLTNDGYCCVTIGKICEGGITPMVIADHTHAPQYIRSN